MEPQEYLDAGEGRVVLVTRVLARDRGSGVLAEQLDGVVWTIREGKTGSRAA